MKTTFKVSTDALPGRAGFVQLEATTGDCHVSFVLDPPAAHQLAGHLHANAAAVEAYNKPLAAKFAKSIGIDPETGEWITKPRKDTHK